ncbi:Mlo14p [Ranunculus cassubicifolius]
MVEEKERSLALDPTWSVAVVLSIFVAVSLLVERSIHRLCHWLRSTNRKPLYEAVEKMKEELMLLGFISLLLTATSSTISNICIDSKFYAGAFTPCTKTEIEDTDADSLKNSKRMMHFSHPISIRRVLNGLDRNDCKEGSEPFVSYEGLEELHRFIFIMAITHISYSCLTMLLAIVKIHRWRSWEDEAHNHKHEAFADIAKELQLRRQAMIVKFHTSNPLGSNKFLVWLNHNLSARYDFHSYMVRSMEEEFHKIVGVSAPLWAFVILFMLFDIDGSNLYFWIAIIPITLVLVVGTKLQHIIATLAWETAGITGFFTGARLQPRDELFWFNKPQLVLSLLHFVLFQNSFELATFFWFWWQFGFDSCFIRNHLLMYIRLALGFAGQFFCSYSTLPLYALVTQMGTNYKAALIPDSVRETLHGLKRDAKRKRRRGRYNDDSSSTRNTETNTVISIDDSEAYNSPTSTMSGVELPTMIVTTRPGGTPLLRASSSLSSTSSSRIQSVWRSSSLRGG